LHEQAAETATVSTAWTVNGRRLPPGSSAPDRNRPLDVAPAPTADERLFLLY
jgi:hypothetical protein